MVQRIIICKQRTMLVAFLLCSDLQLRKFRVLDMVPFFRDPNVNPSVHLLSLRRQVDREVGSTTTKHVLSKSEGGYIVTRNSSFHEHIDLCKTWNTTRQVVRLHRNTITTTAWSERQHGFNCQGGANERD